MANNDNNDEDLRGNTNIYREIGPYLGIGFQLAVTVAAMVFLGRWLDNQTGKGPLFILIFSFLGVGIGMYNFIKTVIFLGKKKGK